MGDFVCDFYGFLLRSHLGIAGVKLYDWLQDSHDIDEQGLVDLFVSVRDAAYSIINKGATYYGISLAYHKSYL